MGLQDTTSDEEVLRIRLFNQVVLLGLILTPLLALLVYIPFNIKVFTLTNLSLTIGFLIVAVCIAVFKKPWVRHFGIIITLIITGLTSFLIAPNTNFLVLLLPYALLILFLIRRPLTWFYLAGLYAVITIEVVYRYSVLEQYELTSYFSLYMVALALLLIILIAEYSKKENNLFLRRINNKQQLLQASQRIANLGSWEYDYARDWVEISEQFAYMFDKNINGKKISYHHLVQFIPTSYHEQFFEFKSNPAIHQLDLNFKIGSEEQATYYRLKANKLFAEQEPTPYRLMGIIQNVTEQVKAQESLQANEKKYRAIVENNQFGIVTVNKQGKFTHINQAFCDMLGYTKEELLAKNVQSLIVNPEKAQQQDQLNKDKNTSIRRSYYTKSGGIVEAEVNISRSYDDYGQVTEYHATIFDMTKHIAFEREIAKLLEDVRKTNTDLVRSNQELEQFAYIASHDLQEPLRMIGNFVQLLEEEMGNRMNPDEKVYVNYIVDGVTRMSDLIIDLLQYSRVGRADMAIKPFSIKKIIDRKVKDLFYKISETNTKLVVNNLPETIHCEPNQLGLVFHNLILNGIKFNKSPQPTIWINCEEKEEYYQFSVSDNGIGIDESNFDKIFEIFKRLHRKEVYAGTGIGLALAKRIILKHGGNIWVESHLSKGTTFYFTIPKRG